ncbi:LysR family transcriptional regulator [Saccharothrix violaceirubra]|uniref:DNA-binding transcriptional LysR family regulator n=1 Tax=Saccharothrix violaceirubra TaxID=413306 RepID=A0A7W7T4U1_9PSEU|nr:LysR family transcriptional regulator [Saccharothrix violaceirubra]MBB4966593.1 DNA-binding transcriptional LysR family regulator [Saccharothrix violaceirubra]
MELEVRHLRALIAIDDARSLTLAARRLHVSQPALSGLLQRIERIVGDRLFVRSTTGCHATPLGLEVVAQARVVLDGMSAITERANDWASRRGGAAGPLRIGGYCGFLHVSVSRWLSEQPWCAGVRVQEDPDERVTLDRLALGALDLALVYLPPLPGAAVPPNVVDVLVHEAEPVFVAMAHDHPAARSGAVPLADLADHAWLDDQPGTTTWSTYLNRVCRDYGVVLDQPHTSTCLATVLELVRAGMGVVPAIATSLDRPANIVVRAIEDAPLWQELHLCYRPGTLVAEHIDEIHARVLDTYVARLGCNPAFDEWWRGRREPALSW